MSPQEKSEIILYTTEDNQTKIEVTLDDNTVWLSQKQMSDLFQKSVPTINEHIKNIYEEGELNQNGTIRNFRIVQTEGSRSVERDLAFYNLDVIISVGYRVKSQRGTQFRIWATQKLREFIVKGFVIDDDKLKNPGGFDYFDELVERVRLIRISERRFYQKITDIYATSVDYDKDAEITHDFFAKVQNKMHWAIHGHTAPEIIYERADSNKPNMGLTNFERSGLRKSDVTVAKNYLTENELKQLSLIVDQYLSFAEFQAMQRKQMTMKDWISKLDDFLRLNERDILNNAGKISKKLAEETAHKEYVKYQKKTLESYESDFDKVVKRVEGAKKLNTKVKKNGKK